MDEYRAVLDASFHTPPTAAPSGPFTGFADQATPAGKSAAGLPSASSLTPHKAFDAQADILNPVLGPAPLPDVNAQALGQTRPSAAFAPTELPRVTPLTPAFTAPVRPFH